MFNLDTFRKLLSRYKERLSNFSRRNKELYYRESKAASLNLTKNPLLGMDDIDEATLKRFGSLRIGSQKLERLIESEKMNLNDHFLLSTVENSKLEKRIDKVRLEDSKYQREFGISGGWLLGPFLCWRRMAGGEKSDLCVTPILKIPIDVKKAKGRKWSLMLEDSTLSVNPSLRLAFKTYLGLKLPESFDSEKIPEALLEFEKLLKGKEKSLKHCDEDFDSVPKIPARMKIIKDASGEITERKPVVLEEALNKRDLSVYEGVTSKDFWLIDCFYVDQINASKMALLADYENIVTSDEGHPILNELLLGASTGKKTEAHTSIRALDQYKEADNHFVVDIDSTQHRAIDKSTGERAVVIQGPPGTGKSQTITNLIANLLTQNKKILFVSEKRAALDVVHSRLQKAKIDQQAVLIHSSDLNRNKLYESFLELASAQHDTSVTHKWADASKQLEQTKTKLNDYSYELTQVHKPSNLTRSDVFALFSQCNQLDFNSKVASYFSNHSYTDLERIGANLDEIQTLCKSIDNYSQHPWLYRKDTTILSESLKSQVKGLLASCEKEATALEAIKTESEALFLENDIAASESLIASSLPSVIQNDLTEDWIGVIANKAILPGDHLRIDAEIVEHIEVIQREKDNFNKIRNDAEIDQVIALKNYYTIPRSFFSFFTPTFWRMRKLKSTILVDPVGDSKLFPFKGYLAFKSAHKEIIQTLKSIGYHSVPKVEKQNFMGFVVSVRAQVGQCFSFHNLQRKIGGAFSTLTIQLFPDFRLEVDKLAKLKSLLDATKAHLAKIEKIQIDLQQFLVNPPAFRPTVEEQIESIRRLDQTLSDLPALDKTDIRIKTLESDHSLKGVKNLLLEQLLNVEGKWSDFIIGQAIKHWHDEILSSSGNLRAFDREARANLSTKFTAQVAEHKVSAQEAVNNTFSKHWNDGGTDFSALKLLEKESKKQRRVLSPREIMEKGALDTMMSLKPCWLMSPLSISQMLPNEMGLFDTVIFDEASQVRVEDAIPSIFRANKMIVVGDDKQMPPTNFFGSGSETTDDDDEEEEELEQSILDLASLVYPAELLEWHYRSRQEALIAYSNRAFYGGRLIAVPNPNVLAKGQPIEFRRISEAYFNSKEGNRVEAEAVVAEISNLVKKDPNSSIGVIAMGQSQQRVIEEEIDRLKEKDSEFARAYERCSNLIEDGAFGGLFVKNLENVQGDERDLILMSVGYAPSRPGKKLYKNFGPLSKKGGGRRLNVAITRARQKIVVFCSFAPAEIPSDEEAFNKNPDATYFARYLNYASAISNCEMDNVNAILNSFPMSGRLTTRKPTRFNLHVKRCLEDLGYSVATEIGSCGFYIDLAIEHPLIPKSYVLGVECDGAVFHSTQYARDRDKIRQELLESRGWKIERIWSQDWSKDHKAEAQRIHRRIQAIIGKKNDKVVELVFA